MNYIEIIATEIYYEVEGHRDIPVNERSLYWMYAMLALAKGQDTTPEDVHNAWAAWRTGTMPEHRSLVPFGDLSDEVRRLDEPYATAIHRAATRVNLGLHEIVVFDG